MPLTTTTTASAFIPERWELKALKGRYAKAVAMNRVTHASQGLLNYGDIYHFPVQDELTGGTITIADAEFAAESLDPTDQTVTVNTWRYVAFDIPFVTQRFANVDLKDEYAPQVGERLAELTDTDILSLASSIATTNVLGNSNSPERFDDDMAFAALLILADLDVPKSDLSFFLAPIALYEGLYTKDRWTAANMTGLPKSVLTTGFEFPIMGVPVYTTTALATVAEAHRSILAHKDWSGVVLQIKLGYEKASRVGNLFASNLHFWHTLYGFGQLRSNHAVQMYTRRTRAKQ